MPKARLKNGYSLLTLFSEEGLLLIVISIKYLIYRTNKFLNCAFNELCLQIAYAPGIPPTIPPRAPSYSRTGPL